MKLTSLRISTDWANKNQYIGEIEFDDNNGKIQLVLSDTLSRRLLDIVGDELLAQSQRMASAMQASIKKAQTPLIESADDIRTGTRSMIDPNDEKIPF